ncbi:hypothetical protein SCACP_17270 [Sporomusa carbonis]|uniref:PglZ domain-containing protein n=1 Tax=Sporomusa carbonis TaxID=3076075 RepID=UPI003A6320BE
MGKVYIYADTNSILESFEGIVVAKPKDYVDAYKAIQQAIYADQEIKVLVKNRYCLECFSKMQKNYGQERIELSVYSPRNEFVKSYGINVPEYISDIDIVASGILKQRESSHLYAGMDFESFIMANYVGDDLAFEKFPWRKLLTILDNLDYGLLEQNRKIGLVNKVFMRRVECWKKNASEHWIDHIIDAFAANPHKLYEALSQYIPVAKYPIAISKAVLGDIALDFERAGFKDVEFYNENVDYSRIRKEIQIFLHSLPDKDLEYDNIASLVNTVSGYFLEEFEYILKIFKSNVTIINRELLKKALHKFRYIEYVVPDYDEKLNDIIPPPKPVPPDTTFGIEEWLTWSKQQYLSYRFWMEDNNNMDEVIDSYSAAYGDWIYQNYSLLLSSGKNMLFNTVSILNKELANNELSLIVVIDNFNYKYVELLKEYFLTRGYQTVDETPLLAMLPTVTEVSKQSIFTGEPYNSKKGINYEYEAKKWERMLGKSVQYLKNIGELTEINTKQADIIFLNYLKIDTILHEKQQDSALSTRTKVKNELAALCQQIAAFAKRIGYENKLKVYVVSDHGSTKILTAQENMIEPTYYKGKSDKADHRYVVIADNNMENLHSGIEQYCYVLDKNRFGTKENYLVARRYYRFKDTDDHYVHGGITPEEQIVPLLKFERIEVKAEDIILTLLSNEFRLSAKSKIQFSVKNPNDYAITDLTIRIMNMDIRAASKLIEVSRLDKLSVVEVSLDDVKFTKGGSDNALLIVNVAYKFLGKEYEQEINLPIIIRSIQQNTMNFEDMF